MANAHGIKQQQLNKLQKQQQEPQNGLGLMWYITGID